MRHSPTGDYGDQEKMDTKDGTIEKNDKKNEVVDGHQEADNEEKDVEMEDDPSRAEGVLRFEVPNFSKLKDTMLSDPVTIRNLPWRIMVMPRFSSSATGEKVKSLGIFLQCDPEGEGSSWSCQASAKISVINKKNAEETFTRKITHLFFAKENDWGYSNFLSWSDVTDSNKGFIKNDTIIVEISVQADAPHGVFWDSKKLTGYVGLKNQGATCYMNSLLQTLFFTNRLRKAVYQMPTENDDPNKSVALALQRVFYELQHSDKAVGTKKLTKSFGWETLDSFMQHDVQELCRVLLDNMESKMKGTVVEGTIPDLLEGKTISYIQCLHINYRSNREEPFYDIQLNIKGKKNVIESFRDYISTERLEGDNKYDAGDHGLQEAKKGVIFKKLPPVLHLHLLRFQYDPITDTNYKINDRYEFSESLDLQEFLEGSEKSRAKYTLHAVLVHSGDNHGGHYVVYLNPKGDGKWFKFDDDVVSQATKKEAIENNFGGFDDEVSVRHCTNAYMLVYIQDGELGKILEEVRDEDIPEHLERKFQEEKRLEAQKRKERNEAHLYMDVEVVTEDLFYSWSGNDLFDYETYDSNHFRVRKQKKLSEVCEIIAESMGYESDQVRLWPFQRRSNTTIRPSVMECRVEDKRKVDNVNDMEIFSLSEMDPRMLAFLEVSSPENGNEPLPKFDEKNDVLLFFKYYDPRTKIMAYCGHLYVPLCKPPSDLFPILCQRAGLPIDTKLLLFEEVKPGTTEQVQVDKRLDETIQELMDGDILCFQACDPDPSQYELPTCVEYFRWNWHGERFRLTYLVQRVRKLTGFLPELVFQVDVTFCDKNNPTELGFSVTLSLKMNYMQLARAVAAQLDVDPMKLQFFKPQMYRDFPGNAIKCTYDGTLREILSLPRTRTQGKLYYQILSIPIDVMENKFQFKCTWINSKLRDERELNLFVDKNGTTEHLLREARRHVETVETKQLRLVEIIGNKVIRVVPNETLLEGLVPQTQRTYRIEEIPAEEIDVGSEATLVPVAHFQKELYNNFGTPFLLKLTEGENIGSIRERVQAKLDIPDKEFEKIKFSRVYMGKVDYFPDEPDKRVSIRDFQVNSGSSSRPWLGLDHVNKAPKRSRYAYVEKAIKIHN